MGSQGVPLAMFCRVAQNATLAVEEQRDRAVVHQLDLHHRAEDAFGHARGPPRATRATNWRYSACAASGRRRGHVAGTAAAAGVAVERELRDHQDRAADLERGEVHLARRVVEDPQVGDLVRQGVGVRGPVVAPDGEQDDEAAADLAG